MTIGFIGQGFIGKNYADDFERRGFSVMRYSLEDPYRANKEKIKECDMVFIAVPTPTTPAGSDSSIVESAVALVGPGKTAVIKSTVLPGVTKKLQAKFPDRYILHSPEFLTEKNAVHDAGNPARNIVGIPRQEGPWRERARTLLSLLPKAPYELVEDSDATEFIKYAGNAFLFFKVLYANIMYDIAKSLGVQYEVVRNALASDPRIGPSHLSVTDKSGHQGALVGRGAGGHCLIKDFAALRQLLERVGPQHRKGLALLRALEEKNNALLRDSKKDLNLLEAVYGEVKA